MNEYRLQLLVSVIALIVSVIALIVRCTGL